MTPSSPSYIAGLIWRDVFPVLPFMRKMGVMLPMKLAALVDILSYRAKETKYRELRKENTTRALLQILYVAVVKARLTSYGSALLDRGRLSFNV